MIELNSEIRNGFEITHERKKLWAVEMELLEKLIQVCEKNHLKMWVDGGTLLGTVRDHGFIPWDDDIDVGMLRDDYDKLVQIASSEFMAPYFFQNAYTDVKYCHGHSQLRKDNTAAISLYDINMPFHQGVFIDIFAYDGIPNSEFELRVLRKNSQKRKRAMMKYCYGFSVKEFILKPIAFFEDVIMCIKIKKIGLPLYFSQYENLFRTYKISECDKIGAIAFAFDRNVKQQLKKEYFKSTLLMEFEDILVPVPIGYDKMLSSIYGNYMTPSKAPSLHGGFEILDIEKSYKQYLPSLKEKHKKPWLIKMSKVKAYLRNSDNE